MARTSSVNPSTPADGQQMDRSNDRETTADMDADAAKAAMTSRRQRLTGEATGVGSVEFDDSGAFDASTGEQLPAER